jgi:arginine decarboxylase
LPVPTGPRWWNWCNGTGPTARCRSRGRGHKLGAGAAPELLDLMGGVFASDVWLDTGGFDQALRDAEALAADVWGSETCFFLGNGSSSGNHAFLLGTLGPGDEVVVARDLRKSLLAALILTGARPVHVAPRLHPTLGAGLGVHPDDVAAALDAHPAARLVVVTSPSYFGVAADLPAVVAAAHRRASRCMSTRPGGRTSASTHGCRPRPWPPGPTPPSPARTSC